MPKPAAKSKPARPAHRPTDYTPEIVAQICDMISDGMSIRAICALPIMPGRATVYEWLGQHKEFADRYAHAREERAEFYADQIIEIADNSDLDPNDRKVRLDARKWIASKLKPGTYGDKVSVGGDASAPIVSKVIYEVVRPKNSDTGSV